MVLKSNLSAEFTLLRGWILDVYPADEGEMAVWIVCEKGQRVKLIDNFLPKIYVSAKQDELEYLISKLYDNPHISSWNFASKYAQPTDNRKSQVLELTLKDSRKIPTVTRTILRMGDYLRYEVHNCDLKGDRDYFFSHDLFPMAFVEVRKRKSGLEYTMLDSITETDYAVPKLRVLKLEVEVAKQERTTSLNPINKIRLNQDNKEVCIDSGDEKEKILKLTGAIKELDPDFVVTHGGDSYVFPYLAQRATINNIVNELNLSRDNKPLSSKKAVGKTYFSYGRTFFRAGLIRLYGRIHIDLNSGFVISEAGFEGLIEIARTCHVPLHTAARNSIGSSMSSLQFYQAIKDDILIPRNKSIPETFKSAYQLLVGDRGGFVFEPKVGSHDFVGEIDFSSMYPVLMLKNNISAETVLCECCPDSIVRIPELNYHICNKRMGVVPKTLDIILSKRLLYKRMKNQTKNPKLKEIYDKRQNALKWILVTCFGYLGYRNSKFGTVDGHIGVCAFGRDTLLNAAHVAEKQGFEVIHGIVDSLWLKKKDATIRDYDELCKFITQHVELPITFEGKYKWVCFLPSKLHPRISVLNRYFGVMENGKIKVRGIEVRRRDTPRFIFNAQTDMINALAKANNTTELRQMIPSALNVVKTYREKLLDGDVDVWDLVITKHISKSPNRYKQHVSQVIAAEQLIKEGTDVNAGNSVRFLFTHSEHKNHEYRVKAAQLIDKSVNPDVKKYLLLLYASAANLLSFDGYTAASICEAIENQEQKTLSNYMVGV